MNITIFSIGTQGDVRPFIALGLGLQAQGHRVCIASGSSCQALVHRHGLSFSPLTADFLELMAKDPTALQKGLNPLALVRTARKHLSEMSVNWVREGRAAVNNADLILGNGMVAVLAKSLADSMGVPMVETHLQPVTPCGDIPPMMLKPPAKPRSKFVNLFLYHSLRILTWQMLSRAYAKVREDLFLPPLPMWGPYYQTPRNEKRVLYGYSEALLPRSKSWPDCVAVPGNWFLDEDDWEMPAELKDFLAKGDTPIYVGFGSMHTDDAESFTQTVLDGIRKSGKRAIFATGWGGLSESLVDDPNIFVLGAAPHNILFQHVSLAIHHGGAGTTAASARAGIPSVVIPFFGDQPFWAWCLREKGVSPVDLSRKSLTSTELGNAIFASLLPAVRERADQLGKQIRAEDGIENAICQLTEWGLLTLSTPRVPNGLILNEASAL